MEITNGKVDADVPESLAALLIKYRGWKPDEHSEPHQVTELFTKSVDQEKQEVEVEIVEPETVATEPEAAPGVQPEPETGEEDNNDDDDDDGLDPAAQCDDDLPDGITFADSAYETVIDPETGEKVRVLKTHCRNGHKYAGANVKIRLRGDRAYRECQTCLAGRKKRAADKRAATKKD